MRLPFVSRETMDILKDELLKAELREAHWVERHDALLAQLSHAYDRAVPEPVKMPERTRDEVIDAIMSRAGNNGQIRSHLSIWAMKARREGMENDKIVEKILHWESPDDESPDENQK